MKVTMGKRSFDTIKQFTDYLEKNYETNKSVSGEQSLRLKCENLEAQHVEQLVQFLVSATRPRVYKLELDAPKNSAHQLALDDAYLASKRQRFSLDFQQQIIDLTGTKVSFQLPINKVRKSKKNWVEGTQGAGITIQVQQQQQQQQQKKSTTRKPKNTAHAGDTLPPIPLATSAELGELIEQSTINAKLSNFAKEQFPNKVPDLNLVWERLVGAHADKITALDHKITHVQYAAMEQIIRHYPEFTYGLVFDDLPAGFYLQKTDDEKHVLCYSVKPEYQHLDTVTPLTLRLESAAHARAGSYRQFTLLKDSPNRARYETEFTHLFAPKNTEKKREEAFAFFLSELDSDTAKIVLIQQYLAALPLTDLNYQGLAQVLTNAGADGVLLVLQQFKLLHEKELFAPFNTLFLDQPKNYVALATAQGLENLNKLAALTREQKVWWNSLVSQHKAAGALTDFNDLFAAYEYFLTEFAKIPVVDGAPEGLKLPLSCPLENIRHMKPALERALFLIKNASDPEEQLICLDDLDYEAHGAYYASRYNEYKLVSRQMGLTPEKADPGLNYSMSQVVTEIPILLSKSTYADSVMQFYRFIGKQDWAFSLDVYQKMEHEISTNPLGRAHYFKSIQEQLLSMVALTTTGKRACTRIEDPSVSFSRLLHKLIAAANILDTVPTSDMGLLSIVYACSGALSMCTWDTMPTIDELDKLWDILLLSQESAADLDQNINTLVILTLNLISNYDESATLFIDNYKKRMVVEQSNTSKIKKFDFSLLLQHLVNRSKLDRYLPNLFADQCESLGQFIALMSLVSDDITPVTTEIKDQPDSDFEAKTKSLAQAILALHDEHRSLLLNLLTDINIEASHDLPSLAELITITHLVAAEEAELQKLEGSEEKEARILALITEQLPNAKIGKVPVNESINGLFDVLKQGLNELQLAQRLEYAPAQLKSALSTLLTAHQEVMDAVEADPLDQQSVLAALTKEDKVVAALLDSTLFHLVASRVKIPIARVLLNIADKVPDEEVDLSLVNEFIEKKSIMVLLKPRIQASYKSSISMAIKSLQTANKDFDRFLLEQVPVLDAGVPVAQALQQANQQFEQLNNFIIALIQLKNKNNVDFRRCISLLGEEVKPVDYKKLTLNVEQMAFILNALNQSGDLVVEPLAILFTVLKEHPECKPEQLHNALQQVAYLTQHRKTLGDDAYKTLLRLSFTHNLAQQTLFPLEQMMQFKSLVGVNEDDSEALFDALIQVIKNVNPQAVPKVDDALLKEVIDKTTSIIQKKAPQVPGLVPLLTLLMKTCKNSSVSELVQYYSVVNKLETTESNILINWTKILTALGNTVTAENIHLLLKVQSGLEIQDFYLKDIVSLFAAPPYPKVEQFVKALETSSSELKAYIANFDKDPKGGREAQHHLAKTKEQIIQEQFDSAQIVRVVGNIKNIVEKTNLSSQEQYDLAQQMTYINAVGHEYPLVINDTSKDPAELKTYKDLTELSRAELRQLFEHFKTTIHKPEINDADKLKAQLNLLAVIREQYFRATGRFAYTTQLIAVLMSLKHQQHNMLMEIDTGEGKSVTTALLATMQWVNANGGTVDVCTANRDLVGQDYHDKGNKEFFTSLGIESSKIEADSPKGTYRVGGINYSTIGDLALYCSRAKLEGEPLTVKKNGYFVSRNLVLDESDFSALDDRTLFNLTLGAEGGGNSNENPYAWIYPLVNEFINQEQFKNLDPVLGWTEDQDLSQLKEFLDKHAPTGPHKALLKELPDRKFNLWVNSAIAAQRLVEGEDFDIPEGDNEVHMAVPYNLKTPQVGSTFSNGIQQFLHARLQKEYVARGWKFPIDPELLFVDSVSAKDLLDDYKAQGRTIGLSGTLGTNSELVEQRGKFNMEVACRIPPHLENKRQELATQITKNKVDHLRKIKDAINKAQDGQPIVLIAQDANEVKYLEEELKKYFTSKFNIGAFTGKETAAVRQQWVKDEAGKNNTITIATSLLGRGTDFDTKHPQGFLAIQTYLDSARNTRQIIGRVGRNGKLGQYCAIYEERGLVLTKSWLYESTEDRQKMLNDVAALQRKRSEAGAVERHYVQTVSGIQQVVLKQFEEWQAFMRLVYPHSELHTLNNDLLVQREDLIRTLAEKWQECLELSDPEKKYANPYERRDRQGKLLTTDLEAARKQFELLAVEIWNEKRALLKAKADSNIEPGSVNELRSDYMAKVSLTEQLELSKLAVRQDKKDLLRAQKKAHRHVASAVDANGAMLQYAEGDLKQYRLDYAKSQTELFKVGISSFVANNSLLKRSARKNLLQQINKADTLQDLVSILNEYAHQWLPETGFAKKYEMQSLIQELLYVYQHVGLEETPELQTLREIYFDNVADELVDNLESTLSWAIKGNRGFGYWLERKAVTTAANEILQVVSELKATTDMKSRQVAIKNLYKVLAVHEAKLEGLWIFSFGHKNTRTLIKQTLATLDGLIAIGSGEEALDARFIRDCKEEAIHHVMYGKFNTALHVVEKKQAKIILKEHSEWDRIKECLSAIQKDTNSVYAFYEMNNFLVNQIEELRKTNSNLVAPLTAVRGEIRKIWDEYSEKHQDLMDESKYFELKAAKIKTKLNHSEGFNAERVTLKSGHNGFSDYLDLIVESKGTHPLLAGFSQYNSQISALTAMQKDVATQLSQTKQNITFMQQAEQVHLPLLLSGATSVFVEQFPEQCHEQVRAILQLKAYANGQLPKNLSSFAESVQTDFQDREVVKDFELTTLDLEKIGKIKDPQLQTDFIKLYNKIHKVEEPRSIWSRVFSFATSFMSHQESQEDWLYQFHGLKNSPNSRILSALRPDIDNKQTVLTTGIAKLHQDELALKKVLEDKEVFLKEKVAEEEAKGGVYCKRFKDMQEFYDFEAQINEIPTPPTQDDTLDEPLPPVPEDVGHDDDHQPVRGLML